MVFLVIGFLQPRPRPARHSNTRRVLVFNKKHAEKVFFSRKSTSMCPSKVWSGFSPLTGSKRFHFSPPRTHAAEARAMSNKRAKMDASIVMDEVDGLAAKELFGKGERRSALSTRDWTAARVVMSARGHRRLPVRRRPWVPRSPASHACFPLFAGVCYTYDDIIFHPGHINFAADAVSAHPPSSGTLPSLSSPPICLLSSHPTPPCQLPRRRCFSPRRPW